MPRVFPALLCLVLAHTIVAADVLVLENGDRLTGELLRNDAGTIVFRSDVLGQISVPATRASVNLGAPAAPDSSPDLPLPLSAMPANTPEVRPKESAPAAAADSTARKAAPPPPKNLWNRRFELGVTLQSGRRDRTDVALRLNLERKTESKELRFQGRYLYGEADDKPSTDTLSGSARLRHSLSTHTFAQGEMRYERDGIKQIDHDFGQSLGVGRKITDTDTLKLSLGGGAAVRYREASSQETGWSYLVDAFQDLSYAINSRVSLTQDLSVLMAPFEDNELTLRLNAALTNKISNKLNLSMRYEFEYDRSLLPEARESQRILTSLGYVF